MIFFAFFASHKIIGCCESLLPDMIRLLKGCQSTHLTSEPWPCKTLSSVHVTKSNMRTVRSSEQDVNLASVGEKLKNSKKNNKYILDKSSQKYIYYLLKLKLKKKIMFYLFYLNSDLFTRKRTHHTV